MGSLEAGEAAAAAVAKTPNRVTLDSLKAKVISTQYFNPAFAPHVTIVAMEVKNGFVLVGKSAPADPANFDPRLGVQFAEEDCIRQLWALEGYALRDRMSAA
jgi:hypothetical protein